MLTSQISEHLINNQKVRIVKLDEIPSTNDFAKEYLQKHSTDDSTVIIALHQTKGRGNAGNHWEAEAGKNLTFSLILKPEYLEPVNQFKLNQTIALGILDFVKLHVKTEKTTIKWPNDIYVGNKKNCRYLN